MKKVMFKIWSLVMDSDPVREGVLAYLEMPEQNIWYALLVVGIIIWAYKKPNKG